MKKLMCILAIIGSFSALANVEKLGKIDGLETLRITSSIVADEVCEELSETEKLKLELRSQEDLRKISKSISKDLQVETRGTHDTVKDGVIGCAAYEIRRAYN